jgi:hypothetical protein
MVSEHSFHLLHVFNMGAKSWEISQIFVNKNETLIFGSQSLFDRAIWAPTLRKTWAIWGPSVGHTRSSSPPSCVADSELELGLHFETLTTSLASPRRLRSLPGSSPWVRMGLNRGSVWARGGHWFGRPNGPIRNPPTKLLVILIYLLLLFFFKGSVEEIIERKLFLFI